MLGLYGLIKKFSNLALCLIVGRGPRFDGGASVDRVFEKREVSSRTEDVNLSASLSSALPPNPPLAYSSRDSVIGAAPHPRPPPRHRRTQRTCARAACTECLRSSRGPYAAHRTYRLRYDLSPHPTTRLPTACPRPFIPPAASVFDYTYGLSSIRTLLVLANAPFSTCPRRSPLLFSNYDWIKEFLRVVDEPITENEAGSPRRRREDRMERGAFEEMFGKAVVCFSFSVPVFARKPC
ncbi:hypothetical protein KM043_006151 [Ampulex compressa]|nr:hypothetical protein KM043_006151 [Ampulex compressa]